MVTKDKYSKHYEENAVIKASTESIFSYADNHTNLSSHMNTSSWMMGGGSMETRADDKRFQEVGSHIRMQGKVFGISLFLDEVIVRRDPPYRKAWETVGDVNLLVIDQYKLGFEITPKENASNFRVYIDYDLPKSLMTHWLGSLFGGMYAKWCVSQMIKSVGEHFRSK